MPLEYGRAFAPLELGIALTIQSLEDRHYLVLGGSSGIGYAAAAYLARAKSVVTICGRNAEKLEAAHQQLIDHAGARKGHIRSCIADGRDAAAVDAAVAHATDESGRIDGVFVVAGGGGLVPVTEVTLEWAADQYALNVFPLINTIVSAVPRMKELGGSIVALSSAAAAISYPRNAPYSAAKAGLEHYARVAADELGVHRIRVNAIRSGFTRSPDVEHFVQDREFIRKFTLATPLAEPYGEPEDFGPMVGMLLSPDTRWITGQVFAIDGGLTLRGYGGGIFPAGME
jgi:NAD(P)-dependent dehydrogenase (short-subunit alcohol dehydrogenase family)